MTVLRTNSRSGSLIAPGTTNLLHIRRLRRSLCDSVAAVFLQESRAGLAAVTFLTRIPVPGHLNGDDVARAGAYFPVVGASIGGGLGLLAQRTTPAMALVVQTLVTGALHLDALADSADALGSADRERALEIMRDSRVGSFGTVAICLDLMVKASALAECDRPVRAGLSAGALSRAVPVVLAAALPYARTGGTGQALSTGSPMRATVAVGLALAISHDPGAALLATALGVLSAGFWQRKIGGVTGDTLGASIELTETLLLVWSAR